MRLIAWIREWFAWRSKALKYKAAAEEAQAMLRTAIEEAKKKPTCDNIAYTVIDPFSYDNQNCMMAIAEVARNPWVFSLLFKMQQDELCALQKVPAVQIEHIRGRLSMIDTFGNELRRLKMLYDVAMNAAGQNEQG